MDFVKYVSGNLTPKSWSSSDIPSGGYRLVSLSETDPEFEMVCKKLKATLPAEVTAIKRVENPFLWGCYLLKKEEYTARGVNFTEEEFFHCTSPKNMKSIAQNNFDWRKVKRHLFGRGISFSPSAHHTNTHANHKIGQSRVAILTKVIVGNKCHGYSSLKIPPTPHDSSYSDWGSVHVKYCDNEFYPCYVAFYSSPPFRRGKKMFYQNE